MAVMAILIVSADLHKTLAKAVETFYSLLTNVMFTVNKEITESKNAKKPWKNRFKSPISPLQFLSYGTMHLEGRFLTL